MLTLSLRIAHLAYTPECFVSSAAHREHNDKVLRDHTEIVEAIRAGEPGRAEDAARRHAELGRLRIMDTLARDVTGKWDIDLAAEG